MFDSIDALSSEVMDLLGEINKKKRAERKKKLEIRYVAVKYSGIVKNTASDESKAKVRSPRMTEYSNKIFCGD